jgi:Putative auto-transporter adhesin, head GIN domain
MGAKKLFYILLPNKNKIAMRKPIQIWAALPLLFLWQTSLSAQTEIKVDHFDEFSAIGSVQVKLEQGTEDKVVLYIDGIPEKDVDVRVRGGVLRIQIINGFVYRDEIVKAYVTYKSLRGVRANAGARVEVRDTMQGELLMASATSGGQLELFAKVKKLEGSATEGGILRVYGEADKVEFTANTGGVCHCSDLTAQQGFARASTGGRVEIFVVDTLKASASLGGEVRYRGEPKENASRLLFGEVRRLR